MESLKKTRPVPLKSKCREENQGLSPREQLGEVAGTRAPQQTDTPWGSTIRVHERCTFPHLSARPERQEEPGVGVPSVQLLRARGRLCTLKMCRDTGWQGTHHGCAQASVRLRNNREC